MKKNILIMLVAVIIIIAIVVMLKYPKKSEGVDVITINYYETLTPTVEGYKSPQYTIKISEDGKVYENDVIIKVIDINIILNYISQFVYNDNLSNGNQMFNNKYSITIKDTPKFYSNEIAYEILELIQVETKF